MARSDFQGYPGLAFEAGAPETRSRAVSLPKQCGFVVGLCVGRNKHLEPPHMPEQGARPHIRRRSGRCRMSDVSRIQTERKERTNMPAIMERELIEIRHEWVCSQCECQFYNPGCILTGLTLREIMQHVKNMREKAFAEHVCPSRSGKQ